MCYISELPLRGSSFELMYSRPSGPIAVTWLMHFVTCLAYVRNTTVGVDLTTFYTNTSSADRLLF